MCSINQGPKPTPVLPLSKELFAYGLEKINEPCAVIRMNWKHQSCKALLMADKTSNTNLLSKLHKQKLYL